MLADLLRCGVALPRDHYLALETTLGDACGEQAVPLAAFRGANPRAQLAAVIGVRSVLAATRNESMAATLETALNLLAGMDASVWLSVRGMLLSLKDDHQDPGGSVPIAAWLSLLVTEVDGRRLENTVAGS